MRHFTIALLLLGASAITSCNKSDSSNPVTPITPVTPSVNKKINASQLLGKWEIVSAYNLEFDSTGTVISASGLSQTYHEHSIKWDPQYGGFITFNADNTFDHSNVDGTDDAPPLFFLKQHGTYELRNNDTTLALLSIGFNNATSMENYEVVEFRNNYFHLLFRNSFGTGKTSLFHYEFKQ